MSDAETFPGAPHVGARGPLRGKYYVNYILIKKMNLK